MRRRFTAAACVFASVAVLAAGCVTGPTEPSAPSDKQLASAVEKSGGMSVTLRAQPAALEAGGTFSLTLDVRNLSSKPESFQLPTGQEYDFVAFQKGGEEAWRWSQGMFFTQAISEVTIAPGENKVYKVAWDTTGTAAGLYSVQGYFMGLEGLRPTVSVEIAK